jgi:Na+/H+ antiporter NhaD/arsenite permease-like protein
MDIKYFPIGRPAAALVGALLMVVFHVVTQSDVYEIQGTKGNLQTVFLLVGMMMLSFYYDREGILHHIGLLFFGKANRSFKNILWKVCLLSAFLSALITNDATCLVITPLLLKQFSKQKRQHKELLPLCLGIATSANIGSAATVFGNPQNAFIASSAGVTLLQFIVALLPAALIGTIVNVGLLYLFFSRTLFNYQTPCNCKKRKPPNVNVTYSSTDEIPRINAGDTTSTGSISSNLSITLNSDCITDEERGIEYCLDSQRDLDTVSISSEKNDFTQSYSASDKNANKKVSISVERRDIAESMSMRNSRRRDNTSPAAAEPKDLVRSVSIIDAKTTDKVKTKGWAERTWRERIFLIWLGFITLLVIVLLAIPPPPAVRAEFNLGLVPLGAAILTMVVDTLLSKTYAHDVLQNIDWTVILLFMGLFVWLEGFQNTCYISKALDALAPLMNLHTIEGVLLFTVVVIIGSNIFSNVPLTILIVGRINDFCGESPCTGPLPALLLAWISTIAGNFTLIGSIANLIVAEKALKPPAKYKLTFWNYIKFGFISTFIILFGCLPIVYFIGRYVFK